VLVSKGSPLFIEVSVRILTDLTEVLKVVVVAVTLQPETLEQEVDCRSLISQLRFTVLDRYLTQEWLYVNL
jgi:hypothetical protein